MTGIECEWPGISWSRLEAEAPETEADTTKHVQQDYNDLNSLNSFNN